MIVKRLVYIEQQLVMIGINDFIENIKFEEESKPDVQ